VWLRVSGHYDMRHAGVSDAQLATRREDSEGAAEEAARTQRPWAGSEADSLATHAQRWRRLVLDPAHARTRDKPTWATGPSFSTATSARECNPSARGIAADHGVPPLQYIRIGDRVHITELSTSNHRRGHEPGLFPQGEIGAAKSLIENGPAES
jgi:hypothetical protein